jgi:hypothetical protein
VVCPKADRSERFRNAVTQLTRGAREEHLEGCALFTAIVPKQGP